METPNNLKILGHNYTVELKPRLSLEEGAIGRCCANTQRIQISTEYPESGQAEGLLREIMEALKFHLELDMEHPTLSRLSECLFQVIRDNGLDFTKAIM